MLIEIIWPPLPPKDNGTGWSSSLRVRGEPAIGWSLKLWCAGGEVRLLSALASLLPSLLRFNFVQIFQVGFRVWNS